MIVHDLTTCLKLDLQSFWSGLTHIIWLGFQTFQKFYKSSEEATTAATVANALGDWWWSSILHSEKKGVK